VTADHIPWVLQAMDEVDFVLNRFETFKDGAQFEICTVASGPPFWRVNTISPKHKSKTLRCLRL
jgi:hypothetical protein